MSVFFLLIIGLYNSQLRVYCISHNSEKQISELQVFLSDNSDFISYNCEFISDVNLQFQGKKS